MSAKTRFYLPAAFLFGHLSILKIYVLYNECRYLLTVFTGQESGYVSNFNVLAFYKISEIVLVKCLRNV